ncbi:MAG: pilus assembly protein PilM [Candidatus Theseobacter exili]|nr:pilus assembly protein PilM [Candidatus Theseobacter exili]
MKKYISSFLLDDNHLKIVVTTSSDRKEIKAFSVIPYVLGAESETISKLKEAASFQYLSKSYINIVIPRHYVTIRTVELPSSDPEELQKMAEFQAMRQVPYTQSEIVLGIEHIRSLPDDKSLVMLIIVHKKIIDRVLGLLVPFGLHPDSAIFSSEALGNLLVKFSNKEILEEATIGIVEIDYNLSHVVVLDNNNLAFSRSIPIGQAQLSNKSDSKNVCDNLVSRVKESLDFYSASHPGLGTLFISASESVLDKICPLLKETLPLNIESIKSSSFAVFSDDIKPLLNGYSIASLCGALYYEDCVIDLMPAEVKEKTAALSRKRLMTQTAILFSVFIFASSFFTYNEIQLRKNYLSKINQSISRLSQVVKKIELMKNKIDILQSHSKPSTSSLDVLYEMGTLIPKGIFIRTLSYNDQGRVSFKGIAPGIAPVFEWIPKLESSSLFARVKNRYTRKVKVGGKEYADFQIECTLSEKPVEK